MVKKHFIKPRYVLITGAFGGIGRALVRTFSAQGYKIVALDALMPPQVGFTGHYVQADLDVIIQNPERSEKLFLTLRSLLAGNELCALINNAAVQTLGGVESLAVSDWQRTLNVNLVAPFLIAQQLLPELEVSKGCIINISSIHARLTKPNFVAYATSKAALSGMTRAMAVDLGGRVRVNAIEPAAIETEMLKSGFAGNSEGYSQLKACHPQGRIGSPQEVAALALSLATGDLRFLHGACLALDGGIGARLHDPN